MDTILTEHVAGDRVDRIAEMTAQLECFESLRDLTIILGALVGVFHFVRTGFTRRNLTLVPCCAMKAFLALSNSSSRSTLVMAL